MKKNALLARSIFAVLTFAIGLSGCWNDMASGKKEETRDTLSQVAADTAVEKRKVSDETTYILPSPQQIAEIFKKSGLAYFQGLTNSPELCNKYRTGNSVEKALNLGVYSADLSYCILNKQSQESKNYFKCCHDLAVDLGLANAFDMNNISRRLERNIQNGDSVSHILADLQMNCDNILEENNKEYLSVVSFTGAWVESIHFGIMVHAREKNQSISAKLLEQLNIAENVIKALSAQLSQDSGIANLISNMKDINVLLNSIPAIHDAKTKDEPDQDFSKLVIKDEDLKKLCDRIEAFRSTIVKI